MERVRSCLVCSVLLQRNLLYIFSVKRYCSAYWQKYLKNMNGTVCENGFSLCFCPFIKRNITLKTHDTKMEGKRMENVKKYQRQ